MSEQKFTPGPWHLRMSDNATPHIEHGDCLLDEVGNLQNRICVMPAEIMQSYNSLANTRLIAAAPDLIEALQDAEKWLVLLEADKISLRGIEVIQKARAAIAKARGES